MWFMYIHAGIFLEKNFRGGAQDFLKLRGGILEI